MPHTMSSMDNRLPQYGSCRRNNPSHPRLGLLLYRCPYQCPYRCPYQCPYRCPFRYLNHAGPTIHRTSMSSSTQAAYIAELLEHLRLPATAQVLRTEARLNVSPDIHQEAQALAQAHPRNPSKQQQVLQDYFTLCLRRLIRRGALEEALHVFEDCIPLYLSDLLPFSLLFAETGSQQPEDLDSFLQEFLSR